jgi:hypothetical protein
MATLWLLKLLESGKRQTLINKKQKEEMEY